MSFVFTIVIMATLYILVAVLAEILNSGMDMSPKYNLFMGCYKPPSLRDLLTFKRVR